MIARWAQVGRGATAWSIVAVIGCREPGAPSPVSPVVAGGASQVQAPSTTPSPPPIAESSASPSPVIAPGPRIDLIANAARFHHYDAGLVVTPAEPGFAKYDLDYRSGWRPDGARWLEREVRWSTGRRAALTLPWHGGAAHLRLEVPAVARVEVWSGGRRVASTRTPQADPRWHEVEVALDGLAAGEHRFELRAGAAFPVARVELAAAEAVPRRCGRDADATRDSRITVAVPVDSGLEFEARGTMPGDWLRWSMRVGQGGDVIWEGPADGQRHQVPLAGAVDAATGLVELQLERSCGVVLTTAAIGRRPAAAPPPSARPARNAILLVIDTLRADRLRAIADTRVQTPRLTAAAARGWVFANHQAMAPSSPPSHTTLHTGQLPRVHGIVGDAGLLAPGVPVLSALLGAQGFFTAYVGNNDFAMGRFREEADFTRFHTLALEGQGIDCQPVVARTLEVIDDARARGQRFFVNMLPIEPHLPYRAHAGLTDHYLGGPLQQLRRGATAATLNKLRGRPPTDPRWAELRALYDGEVAYFDQCFAALEDGLRARGLADDTALVITSDHGEGLGERGGRVGHAYGVNHELLAVPLILVAPGLTPWRTDDASSALDVAPTVLAALGVTPDPRMQGVDLLARGTTGWPRVVASEYGQNYALRGGRWHLVTPAGRPSSLHDVIVDPEERRDVSLEAPMARRYLLDASGFFLRHRVAWQAASWGALNDFAATSPLARGARL